MSALRYLVSEPAQRERGPGAPLPLLCFLHGYDEAAPMPIERTLTRHGPLSRAGAALARERFVIVAAQLPRAGDVWRRYAAEVEEIVSSVQASTGADPARSYLTGFSFGGNGVFDLALRSPTRWAALWAVDPTRVPARDPGAPIWLSVGDAARPLVPAFARVLGLRSASDTSSTTAQGNRVYLDEGLDHTGSAARAYADERIYGWLLSQRAPAGH